MILDSFAEKGSENTSLRVRRRQFATVPEISCCHAGKRNAPRILRRSMMQIYMSAITKSRAPG